MLIILRLELYCYKSKFALAKLQWLEFLGWPVEDGFGGPLENEGNTLQFLDCFCAFQFHQFVSIAGFDPANAKIRN